MHDDPNFLLLYSDGGHPSNQHLWHAIDEALRKFLGAWFAITPSTECCKDQSKTTC